MFNQPYFVMPPAKENDDFGVYGPDYSIIKSFSSEEEADLFCELLNDGLDELMEIEL